MNSTRSRTALLCALPWLLLSMAVPASARVLELSEINQLGTYVQCAESCTLADTPTYADYLAYQRCVEPCGVASRHWEKNGVAPVDRVDLELALMEFQHTDDSPLICYLDADERIVIPGALCAGAVCENASACTVEQCDFGEAGNLTCQEVDGQQSCWVPDGQPASCPDVVCEASPSFTAANCADDDNDGIPAWLEAHLPGLNPGAADLRCAGEHAPCSFQQDCVYSEALGGGQCVDRSCAGSCTAFHLDLVAQDDTQVLVHVFYDYSPVPARAMDLYIDYDRELLLLEDARPLPVLAYPGKELASKHLADGTLRLSVLDKDGSHPIPTGPIVELVFQRLSAKKNAEGTVCTDATEGCTNATNIAFTENAGLRALAIAPLQGNTTTQDQLKDDGVWGAPVSLPDTGSVATKLRLWYPFDSSDDALSYANVPSAEELCLSYADCALAPDETTRAKVQARLEILQRGEQFSSATVPGVNGAAFYFDGSNDHLRLPVQYDTPLTARAQAMSFSTWFFSEGYSEMEDKTAPQLLFSHNALNERTRYGIAMEADGANGMRLFFFDGDILSKKPGVTKTTIGASLSKLTWYHVGMSMDPTTGQVNLYLDGLAVASYTFANPPSAAACPQFEASVNVILEEEGEVLGGTQPEYIYKAVSRSNLYEIDRVDPAALGSVTIMGDGQYSYRDPHYSPILDKLAFSTNVSGNFEIWIANGDGTNAQQLTDGFGSADLGYAARRPRWAPDGSGLVFESGAFNVAAQDNTKEAVNHLYYVRYDNLNNVVAISLVNGSTVEQLVYQDRVDDQTVNDYRVTSSQMLNHHRNARWLEGSSDSSLGRLLLDVTSPGHTGHRVYSLAIPKQLPLASLTEVTGLGDAAQEQTLLAAHRSVTNGIVKERFFYQRDFAVYSATDQYTATVGNVTADGYTVTIVHNPSGYEANCWDLDLDTQGDFDEDRNRDEAWNVADCYPAEVRELFIEFDSNVVRTVLEGANGDSKTPGSALGALDKGFKLKEAYPDGRTFVRVEVTSPYNTQPLPAGAELAVLEFQWKLVEDAPADCDAGTPCDSGSCVAGKCQAVALAPFTRVAETEYLVKSVAPNFEPLAFDPAGRFEQVLEAAFAPDGEGLLISGVSQARPTLLRVDNVVTAADAASLLLAPEKIRGVHWVRHQRLYPCNWLGGYLHLQNKFIRNAFRGGLDDVRLYSGIRDAAAFRSEADRGHEFIEAYETAAEPLYPGTCATHADCPPFQLCVSSSGTCQMLPCDPNDPDGDAARGTVACALQGGRCTLRPESVEQELAPDNDPTLFDFVCAVECSANNECFKQQCLNGPCTMCINGACSECRETMEQVGLAFLPKVEGCPDDNAFRCESGACVSECYANVDDQSVYLCDSAFEYCSRGRCVLLDWDWWDLAPATMSGAGEVRHDTNSLSDAAWKGYTMAVDQRHIVEIKAFAGRDYGQVPELLVEVRGGSYYGTGWSELGRVAIADQTTVEAGLHVHTLVTEYPFTDIRLRQVVEPYQNPAAGATGLAAKDKDACAGDYATTLSNTGEAASGPNPCVHRTPSSQAQVGYPVDLPFAEAVLNCKAEGHSDCPFIMPNELLYHRGGHPTIAILDLQVDGLPLLDSAHLTNTICSYEGSDAPTAEDGTPRALYFGDRATELSSEASAACAGGGCAETGLVSFNPSAKGFGFLNCPYVDEAGTTMAGITVTNLDLSREWPARAGLIIFDDGQTCTVEHDWAHIEPCYGWLGNDVSIDPYNQSVVNFSTLEMSLPKSFGHDEGYKGVPLPTFPLNARLSGYTGGGLVIDNGDAEYAIDSLLPSPSGAGETDIVKLDDIPLGRGYTLRIAEQPAAPHYCYISRAMKACSFSDGLDGVTGCNPGHVFGPSANVDIACLDMRSVSGTVTGLSGQVSLGLIATDPVDSSVVTRTASVSVSSDGAFAFQPLIVPGDLVQIVVMEQPEGQRCVAAPSNFTMPKANAQVAVTCQDVVYRQLQVEVSGLSGGSATGLTLIERETGYEITVTSNGVHTLGSDFVVNDPYDIAITAQPTAPSHVCSPDAGAATTGQQPDADHVALSITCVPATTYPLTVLVMGVGVPGLTLTLDGAKQDSVTMTSVPTIEELGLDGDMTMTFNVSLEYGDAYIISATAPPDHVCTVIPADGVFGADTEVTAACAPIPDMPDLHVVQGTVSGLNGTGLKLAYSSAAKGTAIDVTANGAFTIPDIPKGTPYDVVVVQAPQNPSQLCIVSHGAGLLNADVTGVVVECSDAAMVNVSLDVPGSTGAEVFGGLYARGAGAKMAGRVPNDVKLEYGKAMFTLWDAAEDGVPATDIDYAMVPSGTYDLFVLVNHFTDFDSGTGEEKIGIGDRGKRITVTVDVNAPPTVVHEGDFEPLSRARVWISAGAPTSTQRVTCWWYPAGTASGTSLPPGSTDPVLATSYNDCDNECKNCEGDDCPSVFLCGCPLVNQVFTDQFEMVPRDASYDVRCWVDVNGDGLLNSGDKTGAINNHAVPSYSALPSDSWPFIQLTTY